MDKTKLGFEMQKVQLSLDALLPIRQINENQISNKRYKAILASLKEVGLIEPLMVFPLKGGGGKYLLVDGHFRHHALKQLGHTHAECILTTDDEGFTYNARISRLNAIQEHKMIVKAVENGVKPERIAAALDLPVRTVKTSMALLKGINEEAANVLKDKPITLSALRFLRRVNAIRQIEIAELLVSANNFSASYTEALVLGTAREQLAKPGEEKKKDGLTTKDIARMEEEMKSLEDDLKAVETSYGESVLNLTLARAYIRKLLENGKLVRFLNANYGDISAEFEMIAATEAI